MSNLMMWSFIVGFFLPLVISVVQQPRFPEYVRAIITFLACLVASAVTCALQGQVTVERWIESALVILVATISMYKGLWKPARVAPEIEHATSPNPSG